MPSILLFLFTVACFMDGFLYGSGLALSGAFAPAPPKGEPLAKPETLPYCQGLSLWERWHGVSRDGEGKPASKRQIYEKALVFQGENLERREPVNSNYRAPVVPLSLLHLLWMQPLCTIGPLRRIAALVTVGVRQNLLVRSVLPLRGQYPKPSAPALHHPAALCTQKKDRFIPVNAFALC